MPIQKWYPARAPEEQMLVCELWPSTPQAASIRSVKPSSPGRPTWYMICRRRPSSIAFRMRPAISSSASSHVVRSHFPSPRAPARLSGWRIRSGSVSCVTVAGPLAQFLPREPGCSGFPSNLRTSSVSRSTYASSPQADSQLKHVVGTSM